MCMDVILMDPLDVLTSWRVRNMHSDEPQKLRWTPNTYLPLGGGTTAGVCGDGSVGGFIAMARFAGWAHCKSSRRRTC